ncbi:hypothetical protein LJC05_00685 [Bacteroides sp. OttesenSCG-928-J23]|nr:hypothetical protein [Bacteroides sp. OttesenSCG-928-J23]
MKSFKILPILIAALGIYVLTGCKDTANDKNNIVVCGVCDPEWLLNVINDVENRGSGKRSVSVYSILHEEQEYILVLDLANSSFADGQLLYTCGGQSVGYGEPLYESVMVLFGEKKLLWDNSKN